MKVQEVQEYEYGVYVWKLPDGTMFANEQGELLNIPSRFGDIKRMAILQKTAAHYGAPEGTPVFKQGARQVSRSEWEDQMERMLDGKIPDPYEEGNLPSHIRGEI